MWPYWLTNRIFRLELKIIYSFLKQKGFVLKEDRYPVCMFPNFNKVLSVYGGTWYTLDLNISPSNYSIDV